MASRWNRRRWINPGVGSVARCLQARGWRHGRHGGPRCHGTDQGDRGRKGLPHSKVSRLILHYHVPRRGAMITMQGAGAHLVNDSVMARIVYIDALQA